MNNEYFKNNIDNYAQEIMDIQPDFYKNSANVIDRYTSEDLIVLDIGNGGVINYNIDNIKTLMCADLEYNTKAAKAYADIKKVSFCEADILKLTKDIDKKFDIIIVQAVIHHLAGRTYKKTISNTYIALNECLNLLNPNGKLIIIESSVSPWFEVVERILNPFMQLFFTIMKFGYTFQYSKKTLNKICNNLDNVKILEHGDIDVGKNIWVMGNKIPRKFTPLNASYFVIENLKGFPNNE